MSFYLEEDDENPRYSVGGIFPSAQKTNDDYSEGGADHFVCDNCGFTDSYLDETSGGLVCVECHTQSQTIIAASQTELEYDDTMMLAGRVSGGHFKTAAPSSATKRRTRKRLEELDQSTTLPTTEQCIIGFQRVLKHSCRQVDISFMKDCPRHVRKAAMQHCQRIWTGYLDAWMKGADFFGRLYPEIRFSFRDAFLTSGLRLKLLRTLTHKASKRVRDEVMTSDSSVNDNRDQTGIDMKEELRLLPIDDQNGTIISLSVPFEIIKDDGDNVQFGHSTRIGYSSGPDDTTGAPDVDHDSRKRSYRHSPIQIMIHRHQKLVKSKTLGRHATALLMSPSMDMAAAIVALAFRPFGVTCHNIQQWIQQGSLPLLNFFPYLPTQERKQLKLIQSFFRINEVPSVTALEKRLLVVQVASGYIPKTLVISKRNPNGKTSKEVSDKIVRGREITSKRQLTPRALPLAMVRAVAQLGLSQEALNYCFALTGLPICDTNDQKGHKKIEWLPKPLGKCRPDKVVGMVELAGVIVTACQFVPKWEEHWYIKSDDAVGTPYDNYVTQTSMPLSIVSYLQFMENNYLVDEGCLLLNDEMQQEQPQSSQEVVSDPCTQQGQATVTRPSTLLRPMDIQPISCQPVKRRGSLAVQQEGTSLRGAIPPAPLGTLVEFVSLNLGTNPFSVLRFCHELSEEMRARNLKRIERRMARTRTTE